MKLFDLFGNIVPEAFPHLERSFTGLPFYCPHEAVGKGEADLGSDFSDAQIGGLQQFAPQTQPPDKLIVSDGLFHFLLKGLADGTAGHMQRAGEFF